MGDGLFTWLGAHRDTTLELECERSPSCIRDNRDTVLLNLFVCKVVPEKPWP